MSTGFVFGGQQQQQQPQQQQTSLFGGVGSAGTGTSLPTFGAAIATSTPSLFGTSQPTATATTSSGFSFSTPAAATPASQQATGFSFGGLTAPTTSAPGTGLSFGLTNVAGQTPGTAASTAASSITTTTTSTLGGGLGGIPPSSGGPRMSTLALGTDPTTGWSSRNDNRAVQELPVPPEILAIVEELKTQMKNHKALMVDLNRASDFDVESVGEQIDEVRSAVASLKNLMHKQELQSASLITDMKELSKDMDLLAQARDVPAHGYSGSSSLLLNYLYDLVDKYVKRMLSYKLEIERAEFSLQTIVGGCGVSAKDLWASLTATKDNIAILSAQVQQLHEDLRNELAVHKNVSQVLYGTAPKPWLTSAISGSEEAETTPPLDKVFSTTSVPKPASASSSLETIYQRNSSMLNRVSALADSGANVTGMSPDTLLRSSTQDFRTQGLSSPFNPAYRTGFSSSYLGSSSPPVAAGLKRSKK